VKKLFLLLLLVNTSAFAQTNVSTNNLWSITNLLTKLKFNPNYGYFTNSVGIDGTLTLRSNTPYFSICEQSTNITLTEYVMSISNAVWTLDKGLFGYAMLQLSNNAGVQYLTSAQAVQPTIGTPAEPYFIYGSNQFNSGKFYSSNGVSSLRSNTLALTAMTFPGSTVGWPNPLDCTIQVYINNAGITLSAIKKNGSTIFTSGNATLLLQPGESFSETYTVGTPSATYAPF
jgi:hypothetical protein